MFSIYSHEKTTFVICVVQYRTVDFLSEVTFVDCAVQCKYHTIDFWRADFYFHSGVFCDLCRTVPYSRFSVHLRLTECFPSIPMYDELVFSSTRNSRGACREREGERERESHVNLLMF